MEPKKYVRLTYAERIKIETLLAAKKSKAFIAEELSRNRSTITRELKLWIKKPTDKYSAEIANWCA